MGSLCVNVIHAQSDLIELNQRMVENFIEKGKYQQKKYKPDWYQQVYKPLTDIVEILKKEKDSIRKEYESKEQEYERQIKLLKQEKYAYIFLLRTDTAVFSEYSAKVKDLSTPEAISRKESIETVINLKKELDELSRQKEEIDRKYPNNNIKRKKEYNEKLSMGLNKASGLIDKLRAPHIILSQAQRGFVNNDLIPKYNKLEELVH